MFLRLRQNFTSSINRKCEENQEWFEASLPDFCVAGTFFAYWPELRR